MARPARGDPAASGGDGSGGCSQWPHPCRPSQRTALTTTGLSRGQVSVVLQRLASEPDKLPSRGPAPAGRHAHRAPLRLRTSSTNGASGRHLRMVQKATEVARRRRRHKLAWPKPRQKPNQSLPARTGRPAVERPGAGVTALPPVAGANSGAKPARPPFRASPLRFLAPNYQPQSRPAYPRWAQKKRKSAPKQPEMSKWRRWPGVPQPSSRLGRGHRAAGTLTSLALVAYHFHQPTFWSADRHCVSCRSGGSRRLSKVDSGTRHPLVGKHDSLSALPQLAGTHRCDGNPAEVRNCEPKDCPLRPYRTGRNAAMTRMPSSHAAEIASPCKVPLSGAASQIRGVV